MVTIYLKCLKYESFIKKYFYKNLVSYVDYTVYRQIFQVDVF